MKKNRILMMAFVAILSVGAVSCDKDENASGNGENNGGGGDTTAVWVDLGLPSGLLWARCNLGANSPEEYGNYYAWGETATKEVYNWSTYKYCTVAGGDNLQTLTKYNTSSDWGTIDNLTTLQAADDAATAALGNGTRTPTEEEWQELINNTTVEWKPLNGVNGMMFTAANGDTLFLPAAGFHNDTGLGDTGGYGNYWSSSLHESSPHCAWVFHFSSDGQYMDNYGRYCGLSVRPVRIVQ